MTLNPGTRLGPYQIQAAIGAGGMGEVYKAKDTRLDRSVAIKVLPRDVSADPDRRARFAREAKTIAGLNHPHICTLHDVGEQGGTTYLVMELLTGETLAQRLEKGPLPLEQALTVATEIADALTAAHRQGVIHRDLKPGNVMLTKGGAKLLDFGLAKLKGHGEQAAAASLASSPTRATPLTSEGTIVGTLQYMAPEQVEGKAADARTDLWALGAILYEMLTGKRAFEGTSAASLIGAILEREPAPLGTLQPLTPPSVDRVVRKCLAKAPDDRWDSAHDLADELRWLRETSGVATLTGAPSRRRRGLRMALSVAAGFGLLAGGMGLMWLLRPAAPRLTGRVQIPAQPAEEVTTRLIAERTFANGAAGGGRTALAWADGNTLLFIGMRAGVRRIYVRRLDEEGDARELAGTEGAIALAVSPDGRSVAFTSSRHETVGLSEPSIIKMVSLTSGTPVTICSTTGNPPQGMAWSPSGEILFSDGRLWRVPASVNSTPIAITPPDPSNGRELVALLPRGEVVLCDERSAGTGVSTVVAWRLSTGERTVLLPNDAAAARYVPTGHLIYLSGKETLFAAAFDAERLNVVGNAETMLGDVSWATYGFTAYERNLAGQFAVAPTTGHLAYLSAYKKPPPVPSHAIQVDRLGRGKTLEGTPNNVVWWPLRWLPRRPGALSVSAGRESRLTRVERGRSVPIVETGTDQYAWSHDGQRLATEEKGRLVLRKADGSDPQAVPGGDGMTPSSWSLDDRYLLATRASDGDIYRLTLAGLTWSKEVETADPLYAQHPEVSPDGRWLAYSQRNAAGVLQIWVRPFPGPGERQLVSSKAGTSPVWNPRGGEIFYLADPEPNRSDPNRVRYLMAVDVFKTRSGIEFGTPRALFDTLRTYVDGKIQETVWGMALTRGFDIAPDGQSFLTLQVDPQPPAPAVTHINVIYNWLDKVKAKVPTGR